MIAEDLGDSNEEIAKSFDYIEKHWTKEQIEQAYFNITDNDCIITLDEDEEEDV